MMFSVISFLLLNFFRFVELKFFLLRSLWQAGSLPKQKSVERKLKKIFKQNMSITKEPTCALSKQL